MKKGLVFLCAVLMLVAALPCMAFADSWDVSQDRIAVFVDANGVQQVKYAGGTWVTDTNPVITGSTDTNYVFINVADGQTANVTFSNLTISSASYYPVAIVCRSGNVNIELDGVSTLTGGVETDSNTGSVNNGYPGLWKYGDGTLTINDADGNGTLTANGGEYAAGIGGVPAQSVSSIVINGGTINANGGDNGAGIGGGSGGSVDGVTINGGVVNAKGGISAAGIGGGNGGNGTNITINGGIVNAVGQYDGSGIGGGNAGSGSNLAVTGGQVTASGSNGRGSGMGGGYKGTADSVVISGDAQVTVQGGKYTEGGDGNVVEGAPIGNGATENGNGEEVVPDTSNLSSKGSFSTVQAGEKLDPIVPVTPKTPESSESSESSAPSRRVDYTPDPTFGPGTGSLIQGGSASSSSEASRADESSADKNPNTGDDGAVLLYGAAALLTLSAAGALLLLRRRRDER